MDKSEIEIRARNLHREIWERRAELWPGKLELSVVEIVDPATAARVLDVEYQLHPRLRWFTAPLRPLDKIAGILDRKERRILVSEEVEVEERRFTAAHEIGHLLLHEGVRETYLHRDRPKNGLTKNGTLRPWYETEADYFAACFLMPKRRVMEAFQCLFSDEIPFEITSENAKDLFPDDPAALSRLSKGSLANVLASVGHFRDKKFLPLYRTFRVSVDAMARRLDELGLVQK
jgi:hypothetical protein